VTSKQYLINERELMNDWDLDKNQDLNPADLLVGSNKRAAWICQLCNNKWKTAIHQRAIRKTGCRKCSSRKRLSFNINESIFKTHPDIAKDWSPDKNGGLAPSMFSRNSRYEANWRCHTCGVETTKSVRSYLGCRQCKEAKHLEKNNLELGSPEISKEWDKEKNIGKLPSDFRPASNQYAWWLCSTCGHSWSTRISNRTSLGRGCPLCANKIVVTGKNDLATTRPYLSIEWHPTKNKQLTPENITYGSGKKVWWLCPNNHEYEATILHRAHGTECPKCNEGRQTSFAEQATYFYIKQLYPDALNRYSAKFLGRMELDIHIPSIKLAIEYDGEAWHKKNTIKREERKYQLCKENGIKLIRLREKMPEFPSDIADEMFGMDRLYEPKNLEQMLGELLKRINYSETWMLNCPIDINVSRDRPEILRYKTDLKTRSLKYLYPEISKEWCSTKNGNQLPEHFQPGSDFKAWWECPDCGIVYEAAIGKRTGGISGSCKTGCPKCGIEKSTQAKRKAVNIIDPESGEILRTFISISDASRKIRINCSNISMVCKGIRPKAGGYVWVYSNR
jgi:rubredoxin